MENVSANLNLTYLDKTILVLQRLHIHTLQTQRIKSGTVSGSPKRPRQIYCDPSSPSLCVVFTLLLTIAALHFIMLLLLSDIVWYAENDVVKVKAIFQIYSVNGIISR